MRVGKGSDMDGPFSDVSVKMSLEGTAVISDWYCFAISDWYCRANHFPLGLCRHIGGYAVILHSEGN